MSLPPVVEGLLLDVVADGFVLYCCGDRAAPTALVASYEWDHCIDLVTIRDFDRITTARVPKRGTVDIFVPEVVVWAYQGPPQHALRALLDLVHPAHAFREGIGRLLMRRTLTERGSNPAASAMPMTRADAAPVDPDSGLAGRSPPCS